MNPNDPSTNSDSTGDGGRGTSTVALNGGDTAFQNDGFSPKDLSDHWKVLLGEFIHLLGLFWVHSRTAKTARASDVIFHQLMQHIGILKKMPDNDGCVLVRQVRGQTKPSTPSQDYNVLFGGLMITSRQQRSSATARQFQQLNSAMGRAFECFAEQDIHSLFLRTPGHSPEEIEQFRFAIHILTRYYKAARENTSIAFRYYGRSLTIPLINDFDGRPDPNLTVMAALNGLSAINARELIRQAKAYLRMHKAGFAEFESAIMNASCYDQIFMVRSLRSQIIKPPVEINNLICPYDQLTDNHAFDGERPKQPRGRALIPGVVTEPSRGESLVSYIEPDEDASCAIDRKDLARRLNTDDPLIQAALDRLYTGDYATLGPAELAEYLATLSRLLHAVDSQCQDPAVMESVVAVLQERMNDVPDHIMANIVTHRQGIKIVSGGRSVLVGLVHPRIFDLVTLLKERVVVRVRMATIKEIAFQVDPGHINLLAERFGIEISDAHQIFEVLKGCFSASGCFIRPTFESRVGAMNRNENSIFEILWCFLKQTPLRNDRLNLLNAIQLLMARLSDPQRAFQFLMGDICQAPLQVDFTDRNAFVLANILLHKENRELYVDVNRTPEDALKILQPLNQRVRHYAKWRLEVDQRRFLNKLRTVSNCVGRILTADFNTHPRGALDLPFLLALEREAFIFLAILQGHTARKILRDALGRYGDPQSDYYQYESSRHHLPRLIAHLQIVLRALGRAGNYEDIARLKTLERNATYLAGLDPHPAHGLKVKQVMRWVPEALKMIQSNSSCG